MTTLADLRGALRTLLNDTTPGAYLWSDEALNLHIADAIRSYSRHFPRERQTAVTTVAGQAEYDLPADCVAVARASLQGADYDTPLRLGGDAFGDGFEVYGGKLILLPTPEESGLEVAVHYLASHAPLALDADVSTAPVADEDLLLALACATALQSLATEEAKRQAFRQRAGQPMDAVAALYRGQYEAGVRARRSRVRERRLVT